MQPKKPQICFLLALWGKNYISLFCDISLRSLLAEGNIPAMAKEYDCIFTLLTKPQDIPFFEAQPLFARLKEYCEIRYVDISDAIFRSNHPATLTVVLERGMRTFGDAMLNTYFIYLVADYLFARDSLSGLLPYIRKGVSAITAGNYQVVEEEVMEDVKRFIDPGTGTISIPNRELVAWSLRHLHPITVANMINVSDTQTLHTNRIFWRVDADTMIGRFYLRHMLCIKPELADYVIGSSCDYSFVEEMCPSGNVVHLSDSDEYFIVELQPLLHEEKFIEGGRQVSEALTLSLAEWATAQQRANAHSAIVFHAKDIPAAAGPMLEESQRYIRQVERAIPTPPLPVRGHFYWVGCIQSIVAHIAAAPHEYVERLESVNRNIWESPVFGPPLAQAGIHLDGYPTLREQDMAGDFRWTLVRWYIALFGTLPDVHFWHPRYLDYLLLKQALEGQRDKPILLVIPAKSHQWYEWSRQPGFFLHSPLIAYREIGELRAELRNISSCVISLTGEYDAISGKIFEHLVRALPKGCKIHIFIKSTMFSSRHGRRSRSLRFAHLKQRAGVRMLGQRTYPGRLRGFMDRWLRESAMRLLNNRGDPFSLLWFTAQVGLLHLCYAIFNPISLLFKPFRSDWDEHACSTILSFVVEKDA